MSDCYDLMDSAYDAQHINEHSRSLGHVPIVDPQQRGGLTDDTLLPVARELSWAEADRYRGRTMIKRVNARLKDEFGGRNVRVRGAVKVMAHWMFGVLALTVDQLLRPGAMRGLGKLKREIPTGSGFWRLRVLR